jgi:hypothetical protein
MTEISLSALRSDMFDGGGSGASGASYYGGSNAEYKELGGKDRDGDKSPSGRMVVTGRNDIWHSNIWRRIADQD